MCGTAYFPSIIFFHGLIFRQIIESIFFFKTYIMFSLRAFINHGLTNRELVIYIPSHAHLRYIRFFWKWLFFFLAGGRGG